MLCCDFASLIVLPFTFRYHSAKRKDVITDFLGFVVLKSGRSEAVTDSLLEYLSTIGLDYKQMTGLGTDGGLNLCGCNNSLYTRLKELVRTFQ